MQTNLLEPQLFTYTARDLIEKFDSFQELNEYLKQNPELMKIEEAGFVSLLSYEGELEIQLYKKIIEADKEAEKLGLKNNYQIKKPKKENFIDGIKKCQEYIKEGDIYQANLAHKFEIKSDHEPDTSEFVAIYSKLKQVNPAPYNALIETDSYIICSSSPESFLEIKLLDDDFIITSSPIKGTASLEKLDSMLISEKEKAEHIMIVDLIRNDLSRIAQIGSVNVEELLSLEKYENLYHFVSKISALITKEKLLKIENTKLPDFTKIMTACFPGGSITGTPKKRAMEIIEEIESEMRGPYTGSLGFYKFSGYGCFNILIRTIVFNKKTKELSFHSGAGITSSSIAEDEYQETLLKAEKLMEIFHD